MNETINTNGRIKTSPKATTKATTKAKAHKAVTSPRKLQALQRVALLTGAVGLSALALSVVHCTTALDRLTHCGYLQAALLAIAIDAGMVASEVAELWAHGTLAEKRVRNWSWAYMGLAVTASAYLNALGSSLHCPAELKTQAYAFGLVVPILVFILGRVAGHLWIGK